MMNNNDKPLDWSKFSDTELQALSIDHQNNVNGTKHPTFPYSGIAFEEFAENLASVALVQPELAFHMIKELNVINTHLIKITQQAHTKQPSTPEALQQRLIESAVCHFIITQFNGIIDQVAMSIERVKGGDNGIRH